MISTKLDVPRTSAPLWSAILPGFAAIALAFVGACSDGNDGAPGPAGPAGPPGASIPPGPPPLTPEQPLPGFNLQITEILGGTGAGGNFLPGDTIKVTFTATEGEQGDPPGTPISSDLWSFQEILFAGPTTNYQLILSSRDIAANSVHNSDGSWTFTFPDVIPATVPLQINQENTIPYDSGTLAGQPLPDGTYTLGMSMRQDIEIAGREWRDATSTTAELLLGTATQMVKPQLVTDANCESCHTVMRAHGENRYGVGTCVLCHTNGAEDLNDPNAVAGETLGLSISFQTMIHKVHSGKHLPSVNGKTVDSNGNPVYGPGTPYVVVRSRGEFDFSHIAFPQWPHLAQGMPRDIGYSALTSPQKSVEGAILGGPTNCAACHGDPDGAGPLPPPTDGDAIFTNAIVTRACIACHDDWDPSKPYTANGQTMPAGLGDNTCTACHSESPTAPNAAVNVRKAHTHPLLDTGTPPLWGPGAGARELQFNVTAVSEEQGDGDDLIEVGEKIKVTVDIVDGQGAAVAATEIKRLEIVANGPVQNPNLVYVESFNSDPSRGDPPPTSLLGAGPSHSFVLPERIEFEEATELTPTTYATARTPHYDTKFGTFGETLVWTAPLGGASSVFATETVSPHQNYIDVNDASTFSGGDIIVIDEGNSAREYLKVQNVEGNRIWFAAPINVNAIMPATKHLATSAEVMAVTLTPESAYTLDEATGVITFAAPASGRVLVSYTTDYVVPAVYRGTINNSPSLSPDAPVLDETIGEWTGMPMVAGTYQIGVYGEISFGVDVVNGAMSETTSYTEGSEGDTIMGFRLGTTGPIEPNERIESRASCNACHRDLQFHGSHRRGYENCMLCHGVAGGEDWPQYYTANLASPETPGTTIEFRSMLHKIHHGVELAAGKDYVVAGFRGTPHTYEEVAFPSFVGGTANCAACHGANNDAWMAPTDRLHPDASNTAPDLSWRLVCGSCHDGRTAFGHMAANSALGVESCATCHGDDKELSVEIAHRNLVR